MRVNHQNEWSTDWPCHRDFRVEGNLRLEIGVRDAVLIVFVQRVPADVTRVDHRAVRHERISQRAAQQRAHRGLRQADALCVAAAQV